MSGKRNTQSLSLSVTVEGSDPVSSPQAFNVSLKEPASPFFKMTFKEMDEMQHAPASHGREARVRGGGVEGRREEKRRGGEERRGEERRRGEEERRRGG